MRNDSKKLKTPQPGQAGKLKNLLLKTAEEGIHGLDAEGRIMFENAASLKMFGWEAEEMLGQEAHALTHHHRADGSLYPVEECLIHLTLRDGETRRVGNEVFFRKDGTSFPVEYTCSAMKEDGIVTGVVVSFRDSTARLQAEKALRESEERFRALTEATSEGVVFHDQGQIVDVNPALVSMFGYEDVSEVIGRGLLEFIVPESHDLVLQMIRAADPRPYEVIGLRKDGTTFAVEARGRKYEYRGRILRAASIRDITERRRSEEEIRGEKRFSDAIVNSLPGIFYLFDEQGRFLRWNKNFEKVSGYSAEEVARMNPLDFFEGQDKELIRQRIGRVFAEGISDAEAYFVSKDGSRASHYFTGNRIQLNGTTCLIGVGIDITERKRAEKSLRDLSLAVNASGDVVYMTDKDGIITSVNSQFTDLYGFAPEGVVGKTTPRILKSGKQDLDVYADFWQTITHGGVFRGEMLNKAKDGRLIPIEETVNPFFDENGEIAGFLSIQRDITAQKQAEQALRESEEKYRTVIEQAVDGIAVYDGETLQVVQCNSAYSAMLGYTFEEMKNLTFYDVATRPRENVDRFVERLRVEKQVWLGERQQRRKDGSLLDVEVGSSLVLLQGRERFSIIVRDITERKQMEQALIKSERNYRDLFNNAGDAILIFEPQNEIILQVNATACRLYGFEYGEMVGKSLKSLTKNVERGETYVNAFVRGEASNMFESAHINKAGEEILVLVNSSLIEYEGKQAVLGLVRDVTELKQAENALRRSEARLAEAQQIAHLGYWEWEVPSDRVWWSDEIYRIFGRSPQEFEATVDGFLKYVHPDERALVAETIKSALDSNTPHYNIDHRILLPDGTEKYLHEQAMTEFDESGNPTRMVGISLDITDRTRAEENVQKQLGRLKALHEIDMAITGGFDSRTNLTVLLRRATTELGVDAAGVLLLNPNLNLLEFAAGYGFHTRAIERSSLRADEGLAGRVVMQRSLVRVADLEESRQRFSRASLLAEERFVCYFGIPLTSKGIVKGVLEIFHRSPLDPDQDWLDFLQTLAGQAAIAVENAQLFNNLQQSNFELLHAYDATIEGWSRALDLRDKETEGHTQRVTNMAIRLGRKFGLSDEELKYVRWGGLLHDIGKMGVSDAILLKKEALTLEEMETMRRHTTFAYEMLSPIRYLKNALDIPYCHHEKWDGTGYPRGLKGEQIPFPARIFAVVDVYDAVTSDRPYRDKWKKEEAVSYIREQSGLYFDPAVAEMFLRMIEVDLANGSPG